MQRELRVERIFANSYHREKPCRNCISEHDSVMRDRQKAVESYLKLQEGDYICDGCISLVTEVPVPTVNLITRTLATKRWLQESEDAVRDGMCYRLVLQSRKASI